MALERGELQPGGTVDHYRLERTVHRGRSTVVFAAVDERSGERVALKALGERFADDPTIKRRFVAEAQVAAALDGHPNIVDVRGWGQHDDVVYLVTDYVEGVSLAEIIARRGGEPLSPAEALPLVAQIAAALDFAHARGAVHRDVRPANVMVRMTESTRTAYLVDFGIVTDLGAARPGSPGELTASPDYAAPEQISGGAVDRRTDVYSLACTAFELLTGRPPYAGAPDDAARLAAHLQGPIPSARDLNPALPAATDAVFSRGLAKRPDERSPTAGDFARELRAVFPLAGPDAVRPLLAPVGAAPILGVPTADETPRRRRWPAALAGALVLALVGAGLLLATGGGDETTAGVDTTGPTAVATTARPTRPPTTAAPATSRPATPPTRPAPAVTAPVPATVPTTAPVVIGPYGAVVGSAVTTAEGPESAFALGVQSRSLAADVVVPGSPAAHYAQWIRATAPATTDAVVATEEGFAVTADQPVVLQGFRVEGGRVSSFDECIGGTCVAIDANVSVPPDCQPADGCPHVRSSSGAVTAYQRAVITQRWPQQVVLYELVVDPDAGRTIAAVDEPSRDFRYDGDTHVFVATFPGPPAPGTRTELSITLDDGTHDSIGIYYGG